MTIYGGNVWVFSDCPLVALNGGVKTSEKYCDFRMS